LIPEYVRKSWHAELVYEGLPFNAACCLSFLIVDYLSRRPFVRERTIFNVYAILWLLTAIVPATVLAAEVIDSCRGCHGNALKMQELGYPHFAVTQQEVEQQSGMPAFCPDCHLGNPAKDAKEQAHQGMGRLLLAGR
jgi:hypothetical protein